MAKTSITPSRDRRRPQPPTTLLFSMPFVSQKSFPPFKSHPNRMVGAMVSVSRADWPFFFKSGIQSLPTALCVLEGVCCGFLVFMRKRFFPRGLPPPVSCTVFCHLALPQFFEQWSITRQVLPLGRERVYLSNHLRCCCLSPTRLGFTDVKLECAHFSLCRSISNT